MLELKKPIKLKTKSPIRERRSMMPDTIRFNYGLIASHIEPEDLLHLVTAPPEIYLAEGGDTTLFSETVNKSSQENKLELINNVINRILLSDNSQYTYQDRVYISNVLHKLGVHNDERFMNIVKQLKEQTENTTQLIRLYQDNSVSLRQMIENVSNTENHRNISISGGTAPRTPDRYYLQNEIYKRLDTEEIYSIMNAYMSYNAGNNALVRNETVRLGDQTKISQMLKLQELKNNTVNENRSLYYLHANPYEKGEDISTPEINEKTVTEELVSAVMLNLIDNIYTAVNESIKNNESSYLNATSAFFHAADNTFKRFEEYHEESYISKGSSEKYVEEVNRSSKNEISVLNEFIENTMPLYFSRTENEQNDTDIYRNTRNLINSTDMQNIDNSLHNTINSQSSTENTENVIDRKNLTFNSIEEQVAYFDEQNRIMHEQILKIQNEAPKITAVHVDRERARRDAMMALEHPEEVIREYTERKTEQHTEKKTESSYERLMSKETKEIFERLAAMNGSPEEARRQGIITDGAEKLLMQETQEIEKASLEHPKAAEPAQKDDNGVSSTESRESGTGSVNSVINNITEKIIENINKIPDEGVRAENSRISMTHKAVAPEIDEETVQEIIRQSRKEKTTESVLENEKNVYRNETVVNNVSREIRNETKEDITELITQGVRREMATISNEVMKKIEQRMQTERSRRGY